MTERWKIIEGDALQVLPSLEAGSIDAVVTDPPYNLGVAYDVADDNRADYETWCGDWLAELLELCAGPVLISCGIANLGMWQRIRKPQWVLCWWKPASMGRSPVGFNNWEPILLYGRKCWQKTVDVIRASIRPDAELNGHPCPKPVEWATKQIEMACPPGGLVLDPFAGSGTTGLGCLRTGRRFLGIELSAEYAALARRRLADADTGGKLFADLKELDLFAGGET